MARRRKTRVRPKEVRIEALPYDGDYSCGVGISAHAVATVQVKTYHDGKPVGTSFYCEAHARTT